MTRAAFGRAAFVQLIRAKLNGRRVVASISGGKDSAAMSLWLHELGIEHDRVFADTGWEHPLTYEYLRGELTRAIGPIVEVRGERLMQDLIRKKGMFPSRKHRFCTSELKVKPLLAFMDDLGDDIVNAIGIRADESASRASLPMWESPPDREQEIWRPMIHRSEAEVIELHRRHGLKPNPLYLLGASRVGCFPCINARKAEIRFIAEQSPDRIAEIRALEEEVSAAAEARAAAKGHTLASLGYMRPTFFQAPMQEKPGPDRKRGMWPIDRVVAWSKTARGGRRLELFHEQTDGCARWGMCEPPSAQKEGDEE